MSVARALASVFLDEVMRRRALAPALPARLTVAFTVLTADGAVEQVTALIDDVPALLDGATSLPGAAAVSLEGTEEALRALLAGRDAALRVEGERAVLAALAACFAPGENALAIRLKQG
jgi:hypothetical protein